MQYGIFRDRLGKKRRKTTNEEKQQNKRLKFQGSQEEGEEEDEEIEPGEGGRRCPKKDPENVPVITIFITLKLCMFQAISLTRSRATTIVKDKDRAAEVDHALSRGLNLGHRGQYCSARILKCSYQLDCEAISFSSSIDSDAGGDRKDSGMNSDAGENRGNSDCESSKDPDHTK